MKLKLLWQIVTHTVVEEWNTHLMFCTSFYRCCGYGVKNRNAECTFRNLVYGKAKAIALQVCTGLWGYRGLRLPDFQSTHEGGKIVSPTHRPPLSPRKYSLILSSVTPWVEPRTIGQLWRLSQRSSPVTPSGIKPMAFQLIIQCLNQQHHHMLPLGYGSMQNGADNILCPHPIQETKGSLHWLWLHWKEICFVFLM